MCQHGSPENTIIGPLPERGEGPESTIDEPRLFLGHSLLNQLHLLTDVWGGGGGGGGEGYINSSVHFGDITEKAIMLAWEWGKEIYKTSQMLCTRFKFLLLHMLIV